MKTALSFDQIVGLSDGLSLPQKESLVEILTKRLVEQRRNVLQREVRETQREYKAGKCAVTSPSELMKEIGMTKKSGRSIILLETIGTHDEVY